MLHHMTHVQPPLFPPYSGIATSTSAKHEGLVSRLFKVYILAAEQLIFANTTFNPPGTRVLLNWIVDLLTSHAHEPEAMCIYVITFQLRIGVRARGTPSREQLYCDLDPTHIEPATRDAYHDDVTS